jgi:hypothetical protein
MNRDGCDFWLDNELQVLDMDNVVGHEQEIVLDS